MKVIELKSITESIPVKVGSNTFFIKKGPNQSLVVIPKHGQELKERRGGSSCVRIQHKIIIESHGVKN